MKPIAIRFFMIISLLLSLQTSASMLVTMGQVAKIQASAMPHCADMPGMNNTDQQPAKSASKHQQCKTSCCMSFLAITTSSIVPVINPAQHYHETLVQLPFRSTSINYRPPIFG